jgi:hypothetical protein
MSRIAALLAMLVALATAGCESGYDLEIELRVPAAVTSTASPAHPVVVVVSAQGVGRAVAICEPHTDDVHVKVTGRGLGRGPDGGPAVAWAEPWSPALWEPARRSPGCGEWSSGGRVPFEGDAPTEATAVGRGAVVRFRTGTFDWSNRLTIALVSRSR